MAADPIRGPVHHRGDPGLLVVGREKQHDRAGTGHRRRSGNQRSHHPEPADDRRVGPHQGHRSGGEAVDGLDAMDRHRHRQRGRWRHAGCHQGGRGGRFIGSDTTRGDGHDLHGNGGGQHPDRLLWPELDPEPPCHLPDHDRLGDPGQDHQGNGDEIGETDPGRSAAMVGPEADEVDERGHTDGTDGGCDHDTDRPDEPGGQRRQGNRSQHQQSSDVRRAEQDRGGRGLRHLDLGPSNHRCHTQRLTEPEGKYMVAGQRQMDGRQSLSERQTLDQPAPGHGPHGERGDQRNGDDDKPGRIEQCPPGRSKEGLTVDTPDEQKPHKPDGNDRNKDENRHRPGAGPAPKRPDRNRGSRRKNPLHNHRG